jgi:hypothetical protein
MRKFARHKTYDEVRAQCMEQGLDFNDRLYVKDGWDTVVVSGGGCQVVYNTTNGVFWGTTPRFVKFESGSTKHENLPWFQALLGFFMVEKAEKEPPKLTPVFPGRVKPARVGVYMRTVSPTTRFRMVGKFSLWDGTMWRFSCKTPEEAALAMTTSTMQDLPWQGLAEEPKP